MADIEDATGCKYARNSGTFAVSPVKPPHVPAACPYRGAVGPPHLNPRQLQRANWLNQLRFVTFSSSVAWLIWMRTQYCLHSTIGRNPNRQPF